MSDQEALTHRVFLVRHGETEWAKSGRNTGTTEIDLSPTGATQISSIAATTVGAGKLLEPSRLADVSVSPRKRATRTSELFFSNPMKDQNITFTDDITEWDYGDYEGLRSDEIRKLRRERGLDVERE